MSESLSIDEGWEEPLDSEQVTHVKGDAVTSAAASGEWLVNVSEQVVVPMTTTEVVDALRALRITDRSLVWRAGMQDWTPLGDVPPLRLAAGKLAAPSSARIPAPQSERVLHPPPKEPARAARDERHRRNTLPFGFPVVRDPATIREPAGLHPAPPRPRAEEVEALAIYERATPSLTFSDSVRAEWQGTTNLVHQPTPSSPASSRPQLEPKPRLTLEPQSDPRPKLTLEPQSDPRPKLSLEPQSDPLSARGELQFKVFGPQAPSSLAPTTSEPENELPARGAGLWGDLSVVLASDMRAAKASSKRVTLIASIGSAALASVLTLWFAHTRSAPEAAPVAQPQAAARATAEFTSPSPVVVAPVAALAPTVAAPSSSAHAPAPPSHSVPAVHVAAKPSVSTPPRVVVARPKPPPAAPDSDTTSAPADGNPYADPAEHTPAKAPTAAFKETAASEASSEGAPPKPPNVPSGLEDNAPPVRPAATVAPGF